MATVTNTIKLPDGTTPTSARVEISLVASETASASAAGWVTATDVTVLHTARPTVTSGAWTADLTPNANIDPSGTVYRVTEYVGRDRYVHYIEVGAGGGTVHDLLAEAPTALTPQWLTTHNADTTNVHGIADTSALVTTSSAPELIRDTIGTALVEGNGIDITVSDAGDTITIAATAVDDSAPYVFVNPVGADGQSWYHGKFWDHESTDLGRFIWEAWVRPDGGSGGSGQYWISEGYGGGHSVLMSPKNGNIWNGSAGTSFTSEYTPENGEWLHSMVSWDGTNVRTYVNGVVTSVTAFAGPRRTNTSQGSLYIAGSDHSNLHGALAAVRGWESANSSTAVVSSYFSAGQALDRPFTPHRQFGPYTYVAFGDLDGEAASQFCADYTKPGMTIVDLSPGYGGRIHHGVIIGLAGSVSVRPAGYFERDATCPLQLDTSVIPTRTVGSPPSTPASAKIFDSFTRQNALMCWGNSGLGSTEAGSLGVKTWTLTRAGCFGVLGGRAVLQDQGTLTVGYDMAWVTSNSADMDVRVDRLAGSGVHGTGLAVRVNPDTPADHIYAYTTGTESSSSVTLGKAGSGAGSIATYSCPASWTTLRVVCSGTTITVYCDATQIGQATSQTYNQATGTGAGIYSYFTPSTARRWDNFTVL